MNFNELLEGAVNKLSTDTELTAFSPGSIARGILDTYTNEAADINLELDLKLINSVLSTAVGDDLDKLGLLFRIDRNTAAYAVGQIQISIDTIYGKSLQDLIDIIQERSGTIVSSITIPAGTEITSDDGTNVFLTISDVDITEENVYTDVVARDFGISGNISAGTLNKISTLTTGLLYIKDYIIVSNPYPVETGTDAESDDNYRYRITNYFTASAKGNETAIRLAALGVAGVSDIIVKPYVEGIGTTGIFVIAEAPIVSTGLVNTVQQVCNTVVSIGEKIIVMSPEYRAISLDIVLEFAENTALNIKDSVTIAVQKNIIAYINSLQIGKEFILNKIGQIIYEGSTTIRDYTIKTIAIGDYVVESGLVENYADVVPTNQQVDDMSKFVSNEILCTVCY